MEYPCEIKQQPEQPVMSIRMRAAVADLPRVLGQGYERVIQYLNEIGAAPSGAPFVAYYNQDMQDLDLDVGFPVGGALPGKDDIQPGVMPAGKVATCLFTGPYTQLPSGYDCFMKWAIPQGLQFSVPMYEFYLNDPDDVPEAYLQTLLVFPLQG